MNETIIDHGNVAHQLRTPVNGIIGFAKLIMDGYYDLNDKERKGYLTLIITSGEKLIKTIEELMELSKVNYASPTNLAIISVDKEINKVIETAEWLRLKKNIAIKKIGTKIKIKSHSVMLRFILQNLVTNALKFTPDDGEIKISVTEDIIDEKKFVKFAVADNGVGMSELTKSKLFTNKIVSSPGTDHESGSGLGLIGCLPLIAKLGGKMWAESKLGEGSTFFFTLPINE